MDEIFVDEENEELNLPKKQENAFSQSAQYKFMYGTVKQVNI